MPISARCPSCGASFMLTDDLGGKYVCCSDCKSNFLVPQGSTQALPDEESSREWDPGPERRRDRNPDRDRDRDRDDTRDLRDRYDRQRDSYRNRSPYRSPYRSRRDANDTDNTGKILLWVFGSIGIATLLTVGMCAGMIYFTSRQIAKKFDGGQMKPIDPFNDGPAILNLDDALRQLRGNDLNKRRRAAFWLSRNPVDVHRRVEVIQALEQAKLAGDPDLRINAEDALHRWKN